MVINRKSYAKVNIFLKIVGIKENYHLINSRFMLVKNLFDEISIIPKVTPNSNFILEGDFGCKREDNTIYKIYRELLKEIKNREEVEKFFQYHYIKVKKNIPKFAGLGGGSSNGATFLNICNDYLELNLSKERLANIGAKVGADIPFFIYQYQSANVTGVGEIVKEFKEEALNLEIITPPINSSTKEVYKRFREKYLKNINIEFANSLMAKKSREILKESKAIQLNDLLQPAIDLTPQLKEYLREEYFFSGSGSSFFKVKF